MYFARFAAAISV